MPTKWLHDRKCVLGTKSITTGCYFWACLTFVLTTDLLFLKIYNYPTFISVWFKLGRVPDEERWCVQEDDSEGAAAKLLWPRRSVYDQSDRATMTTSVYDRERLMCVCMGPQLYCRCRCRDGAWVNCFFFSSTIQLNLCPSMTVGLVDKATKRSRM